MAIVLAVMFCLLALYVGALMGRRQMKHRVQSYIQLLESRVSEEEDRLKPLMKQYAAVFKKLEQEESETFGRHEQVEAVRRLLSELKFEVRTY